MRSITLYHGTNYPTEVLNSAKLNNAHNGLGFYMTDSLELVMKYGLKVVKFEVFDMMALNLTVRKIDPSLEDSAMEYVVTTPSSLNDLLDEEYSNNSEM